MCDLCMIVTESLCGLGLPPGLVDDGAEGDQRLAARGVLPLRGSGLRQAALHAALPRRRPAQHPQHLLRAGIGEQIRTGAALTLLSFTPEQNSHRPLDRESLRLQSGTPTRIFTGPITWHDSPENNANLY